MSCDLFFFFFLLKKEVSSSDSETDENVKMESQRYKEN